MKVSRWRLYETRCPKDRSMMMLLPLHFLCTPDVRVYAKYHVRSV
ncbi:hypothetical protein Tco_0806535, partial [Tanacetum coccineum]